MTTSTGTNSSVRSSRLTLAAMVTEQLRKAILRGEYQLGQRLTEAELGIRFDVNSVTVREAFHTLEGEGLIVTVPFCGRSVFRLTADEIVELTMQRASLEAQAAYLAAIRLDDQAAQRIIRAVEVLKTERPGDYDELVAVDLGFHQTVWRAAKSPSLEKRLNQIVTPLFALPVQDHLIPFTTVRETMDAISIDEKAEGDGSHARVAKAILSRKPHEARDAMIVQLMFVPSLAERRRDFFGI